MKIGDKVRFLHEKGGGVVAGFRGNQVLVEDEDGFQIPMLTQEVVVVEDQQTLPGLSKQHAVAAPVSDKAIQKEKSDLPADTDTVVEREGGDKLSLFLGITPIERGNFFQTNFELYLVNDSNYFLQFTYLTSEGNNWHLRYHGEVEPNTQLLLDEIAREDISDFGKIVVQALAYKQQKTFMLKQPVDVQLHIDTNKFFKLHDFKENPFFETAALIYAIVEADRPNNPLQIDARQLKESMYKNAEEQPKKVVKRKEEHDALVVDLHANQLLDNPEGVPSTDLHSLLRATPEKILAYQMEKFRSVLKENAKRKGLKIIFIHGKGEGVLRHAIINELQHKYKQYQYQDASFLEYGYGATQVTIR